TLHGQQSHQVSNLEQPSFESLPIGTISSAITHSSDLDVLRMAISTLNITLLNTNDCFKNCFLR
uniref:hypothetical protein n=1 Tax=Leuconostoc mesenteroides TaxID=1245 RepID=UPI002361D616